MPDRSAPPAVEWSEQQLAAIEKYETWHAAWRRDHTQQIFRLAGLYGTGKTTLARHLGGSAAIYTAFTGKAAIVLREKGCTNARNIDQLLYRPRNGCRPHPELFFDEFVPTGARDVPRPERSADRRNGELERVLAPSEDLLAAETIVVDEGSMIPNAMVEDLLGLGKPIVVLYDPMQLAPVGDDRGGLIAGPRDVFLTEIHRHARDNPLVQLAMLARAGRPLAPGQYGESLVAQEANIEGIIGCGADQILCGTNRTRRLINDAVRIRDGRTYWYPEPGERLVCLGNWHRRGLLNGEIWTVRGVAFGQSRYAREPLIQLEIVPEDGGAARRIAVPVSSFDHYFDFAYALTVHKAQGSQWDSVVVINEARALKFALGIDPARWRYTAITRAAKAVAWVKRLVME